MPDLLICLKPKDLPDLSALDSVSLVEKEALQEKIQPLALPGATLALEMKKLHPTFQFLVLLGATQAWIVKGSCQIPQLLVLPGATLACRKNGSQMKLRILALRGATLAEKDNNYLIRQCQKKRRKNYISQRPGSEGQNLALPTHHFVLVIRYWKRLRE